MSLRKSNYLVYSLLFIFLCTINLPVYSMGKKLKYGEGTMLCQNEHQNPPKTKYCLTCGEQIATPATTDAYCPQGHKNPTGAQFCQQCGQKIVPPAPVTTPKTDTVVCPAGHENPASAQFCQQCGQKIVANTPNPKYAYCPEGHENPKSADFCKECGKKMPRQRKAGSEPPPDLSKDRGVWPTVITLGFFGMLAVSLILANNAANQAPN